MRSRLLPFLLSVSIVAACSTAAPAPERKPTLDPDRTMAFVVEDFARGSLQAEAFLASLGPEAVPWVKPLLESEDPEIRMRALRLLLDSGEDMGVTLEEQVGLLLYEVTRSDPPAWNALRALARLREMGDEALPHLETAAQREDPAGLAARRLLQEWGRVQ